MPVPCGKSDPCLPPSGQIEERCLTSLLLKNPELHSVDIEHQLQARFGVGAQNRKYSK